MTKWSQIIDQMEDQVAVVLQEERYLFHQRSVCFHKYCPLSYLILCGLCREEMALRKAEMEATKVFLSILSIFFVGHNIAKDSGVTWICGIILLVVGTKLNVVVNSETDAINALF